MADVGADVAIGTALVFEPAWSRWPASAHRRRPRNVVDGDLVGEVRFAVEVKEALLGRHVGLAGGPERVIVQGQRAVEIGVDHARVVIGHQGHAMRLAVQVVAEGDQPRIVGIRTAKTPPSALVGATAKRNAQPFVG